MEETKKQKIIVNLKVVLIFLYVILAYLWGLDTEKVIYSELILAIFFTLQLIEIIKRKTIKCNVSIVILYIFSFFCFLSNFWAINSQIAINMGKTLFLLTTFLLLTYDFFLNVKNAEEKLLKIIMYAGILVSLYVILYYGVTEYIVKLMNGERVGTEINNVNYIGLQTSISVIIAIFYSIYNKKRYFFLAILPLIVSLGTGSRKVLILLILGTLILFFLKKEKKINIKENTKKIMLFCIVMLGFIFIARMPIFSTIFERMQMTINSFTGEGRVDSSTEVREIMIKEGIETFNERPILGIGIANSSYVSAYKSYFHNNYVELLADVGIVGFCLYYLVYFYIIYNCIILLKRRNKYINVILAIFLINIVLDFAMVSYYSKSTYIYILLALIVIKRERKDVI